MNVIESDYNYSLILFSPRKKTTNHIPTITKHKIQPRNLKFANYRRKHRTGGHGDFRPQLCTTNKPRRIILDNRSNRDV